MTVVTGAVVPAGPILRDEEGPEGQDPEVVQDFRGVDQFQVAGDKPVTQHLGSRVEGMRGGGPMVHPFLLLRP